MDLVPALEMWLARYGYAGLGLGVFLESVGIPVPGEAALIGAAFAAAHGTLSLPLVIIIASVSGIIGDNVGYVLGRRLGRPWAERHGKWVFLTPARLARVDAFFARAGAPAVAVARFVAGVRVAAAFMAGVGRMPWPVFLRYNIAGAVVWATLTGLAGYGLGRTWQSIGKTLSATGETILILVLVVAAAAVVFRSLRRRWSAKDPTRRSVALPGVAIDRDHGSRIHADPHEGRRGHSAT